MPKLTSTWVPENMLKKLNRKTAGITTDRPVKILQFGEGNFLRAFVDWVVDILNEETNFNGAIQIVQPIAKGMGETVNNQEGLYHVILNGIKNKKPITETRLITSVTEVINPYNDYMQFLESGENPDLKFIVSNTTEAGINFNKEDSSPLSLPSSFPGKLTALLHHRFSHFDGDPNKGLNIIPCELIDRNGDQLKAMILKYADFWSLSAAFKTWINNHFIFCNTLVDRIVPGFPKETITEIQAKLGFEDNLLVTAEPFHLWVIEGPEELQEQFPVGQTNLQVKFVKDQTPYRTRKVRILNGAHTALVPVAYLYGLRTVRESVEDEFAGNFITRLIYDEVIPTLDLPENELKQFANDVIERFQNPYIKHELLSIALNSISKFKTRVLPSVLEYNSRKGKLPTRLLFSFAALIRFYKGDWNGTLIPLNDTDEVLTFFSKTWKSNDYKTVTKLTLANESFWGQNLNEINGMTDAVVNYLKIIDERKLEEVSL